MADLPSDFWAGWIAVLTLVSLAGLAWLVLSIYFSRDAHEESEEEPVWDNTLKEGHQAPPLWWFWLLLGSMVFSLVYLMFFPGLGNYSGLLDWSQGKRVAESMEDFEARFADRRAEIAAMPLAEIQADPELMGVAQRIFRRECSVCHGPEGEGQANMFPDLTDAAWQWGGSPEQIEQTIRQGRNANMIAWDSILSEEDLDNVASYVQNMGESPSQAHPGRAAFEQNCAACHGPTGAGNPMLGAPSLADQNWLYGGDMGAIRTTLREGRFGQMPAFGARLDDMQIRLLLALLAH